MLIAGLETIGTKLNNKSKVKSGLNLNKISINARAYYCAAMVAIWQYAIMEQLIFQD